MIVKQPRKNARHHEERERGCRPRSQSAVTFASERNLEREAVVDERALMRDALKRSMGQATLTEVRSDFEERIERGRA